jgi:hypothetical protein
VGKALRVVRTLHIVDLEGRFVRDITDHVDAGTVTLASSADSQWSFKADLLAPIEIRPLIDVFAPALETHFDDGTIWAG